MPFKSAPLITALLLMLLPACAVKLAVSEFDYPESESARAAPWPRLAPTETLASDITVRDQGAQQATDNLSRRAARLKARANALKRPVLSGSDRRDLKSKADAAQAN